MKCLCWNEFDRETSRLGVWQSISLTTDHLGTCISCMQVIAISCCLHVRESFCPHFVCAVAVCLHVGLHCMCAYVQVCSCSVPIRMCAYMYVPLSRCVLVVLCMPTYVHVSHWECVFSSLVFCCCCIVLFALRLIMCLINIPSLIFFVRYRLHEFLPSSSSSVLPLA